MRFARDARGALVAVWMCLAGLAAAQAAPRIDFAAEAASADTRYAAQWIVEAQDHRGMPFVIVDKKDAKAFVFGAQGQLIAATPVLIGLAPGDHAVPGVGELPPSRIPLADRTTPAGRFVTEPGRNLDGEDVVWFDYDAGLAIHRLRPSELRAQRIGSPLAREHRVSAGCVVVPVAFYEDVIAPTFGRHRGVVYVLPETRPVRDMFTSRPEWQARSDTASAASPN